MVTTVIARVHETCFNPPINRPRNLLPTPSPTPSPTSKATSPACPAPARAGMGRAMVLACCCMWGACSGDNPDYVGDDLAMAPAIPARDFALARRGHDAVNSPMDDDLASPDLTMPSPSSDLAIAPDLLTAPDLTPSPDLTPLPCDGWRGGPNNACWYMSNLKQGCTSVCQSHGGFDALGAVHKDSSVCMHFFGGTITNWGTRSFGSLEVCALSGDPGAPIGGQAYRANGDSPASPDNVAGWRVACACMN
jgi:hypothetical protein